MSRRAQVEALLPELMFIETARKKRKLSATEAVHRVGNAIDWSTVDDAGNNLDALMAHIRQATARALG